MHWCPDCGEPCFCDCDDTDYGEFIPEGCTHECREIEEDEDDYEYDDYEPEEQP